MLRYAPRYANSGCSSCPVVARRGFTLIELLVVISIIALLISILLPVLGASRRTAQDIQCLSQLRQMGVAAHVYVTENDGYLPGSTLAPGGTATSSGNWIERLWREMHGEYPQVSWPADGSYPEQLAGTVFECPRMEHLNEQDFAERGLTFNDNYRSYGYNYYMGDGYSDQTRFQQIDKFPRTTGIAMVADNYNLSHMAVSTVARRHGGLVANVVYVDGHAGPNTLEDALLGNYTQEFWGRTELSDSWQWW